MVVITLILANGLVNGALVGQAVAERSPRPTKLRLGSLMVGGAGLPTQARIVAFCGHYVFSRPASKNLP